MSLQLTAHGPGGVLDSYRLLNDESRQAEVFYREDFLSVEECELLARHHSYRDGASPPADGDGRCGSVIKAARSRIAKQLQRFYRAEGGLSSHSIQVIRSAADRIAQPGTHGAPAAASEGDIVAIVYLNADFIGGYLLFDQLKLAVAPKQGLLVAFRADAAYRHTVTKGLTRPCQLMVGRYARETRRRAPGRLEAPAPSKRPAPAEARDRSTSPRETAPANTAGTMLRCMTLSPSPPPLVPADPMRRWMDDFPGRHPYRCLPMAIANSYGWEVLSPCAFSIEWNGGPERADITFKVLDDFPYLSYFAESNFSHGIVTFHTGYLFRTDPGWHLMATGPFNRPKHGLAPLTGVIETDWLPYPFTMNWQLTQRGTVTFEKGEPFCLVYPVRQGAVEATTPEISALEDDAALKAEHDAWREKRSEFRQRIEQRDPAATKTAWQRFYFRGELPSGGSLTASHTTKLRLRAPTDRRK